jgi:sterol desaturase/sphingolipid hydroxylase (fatty acid hydroxylase superfamily)
MKPEDIVGLMVPATYIVMAVVEKIWPARQFPKLRFWNIIGGAWLALALTLGTIAPILFPVEWLATHRLVDGTRLGIVGGVLVGYPVLALVAYFYHRAVHNVGFLWRWTHQMHHAPQRLDMPGSVYFHPIELVIQNVVQIGTLVFLLGLDPFAAVITGYVAAFYGLFQHWNIRTPEWLGYLIQRPEAHGHHHELNVHAYNYSDFPLWDILFGTFKNPATFEGQVGFAERAPMGKMLLGVDVHATGTPGTSPITAVTV